MRMCMYSGVRDVNFSENFTYVLNGFFLTFGILPSRYEMTKI